MCLYDKTLLIYIMRPVSLAAFASLRRMVYPGIDRSHDGILVVRRDSEKLNIWNGLPELERVVMTSVILL